MCKHLFVDETSSLRVPAGIRISSFFLALYVALLPISTGLTGLIGSISPLNYVAVLYLLSSFIEWLRRPEPVLRKEFGFVYLFFLYTAVSILWSLSREIGWYFTTFLTSGLLFAVAAGRRYSEKEQKLLIAASFVSIVTVFAVTVKNFPYHGRRMHVVVVQKMDPNDFGCGLCVIIAMIMTLSLRKKNLWMLPVLALLLLTVFLSGSRGAMLLTLGMMIWWIIAAVTKKKALIPVLLILGFVCLVILFLEFAPSLLNMRERGRTYLLSRLDIAALLESGGQGRVEVWKAAIDTFLSSNPLRMLFGYGHGGFRAAVLYPGPEPGNSFFSHNMYINALIEGGAVGLGLLLAALVQMFRYTLKNQNLWGTLSLIGLALEGVSLDAQSFRLLGWALIVAAIFKGGNEYELVFETSGDGDRTDLQG